MPMCPLFCMALLRLQEERPRFCGNTATVLKMHVARRMPRDKKSPVCRYSDALAPVRGRPVRYRPMAWPRKPRTFPRPLERRLRVLSRTPGPRNRCLRSPVLHRTLTLIRYYQPLINQVQNILFIVPITRLVSPYSPADARQ